MMQTNTGFYAFLQDRIKRGKMHPIAIHRANKALRPLPKEETLAIALPQPLPCPPRVGPYRVEAITLAEANAYVTQYHRHLNGTVGFKHAYGLYDDVGLRGVAIAGRPSARNLDNGSTIEILRVCTDGSKNACSKLYGAVCRHARKNGLKRVITYTMPEELGASLKASNFRYDGITRGGDWTRKSRPRITRLTGAKLRWVWEPRR
jgi:hypothetical protein